MSLRDHFERIHARFCSALLCSALLCSTTPPLPSYAFILSLFLSTHNALCLAKPIFTTCALPTKHHCAVPTNFFRGLPLSYTHIYHTLHTLLMLLNYKTHPFSTRAQNGHKTVVLPKMFKWFSRDFGEDKLQLLRFIADLLHHADTMTSSAQELALEVPLTSTATTTTSANNNNNENN